MLESSKSKKKLQQIWFKNQLECIVKKLRLQKIHIFVSIACLHVCQHVKLIFFFKIMFSMVKLIKSIIKFFKILKKNFFSKMRFIKYSCSCDRSVGRGTGRSLTAPTGTERHQPTPNHRHGNGKCDINGKKNIILITEIELIYA